MRVAVIGATGRTGRLVVAELLRRNHAVVGIVRSRARAAGLGLDAVVETDARDGVALAAAFDDTHADAVVSCVGPVRGESATVMQDSIDPLLRAMAEAGVRRLIAITASGWVVDGDDPLSRFVAKPILARILREVNADFAATESRIRTSDRDWTIVRPPRLTDRPGRGRYSQRRAGNVRWGYGIRRADLALAVVDLLDDDTTIRRVVSVAA